MSLPIDSEISKPCVVVGGSRGIGLAIARSFVAERHDVTVLSRHPPAEPGSLHWLPVDLADPAAIDSACDSLLKSCAIHTLVFAQRFRGDGDAWAGEIAVSLTATQRMIERLQANLTAGSSIVIVTSVASRAIASEQPHGYHVVKAGLEQLVRYHAAQLGSRGIRVNGVCPGTIVKDESRDHYSKQPALQQLYRDAIPLGRMGEAAEVASVVLFLSSVQASYVTGQSLVVDGGLSILNQESLCRGVSSRTSPSPASSSPSAAERGPGT